MNNALLWIGGLAVATLAALFAVPHFIDWNSHRSAFEEQASRILGREVRVGGDVNLRLLPAPYVEFERIRIAEDGGQTGESLFRADRFTMWLAVPPLLRGVLEAREVTLKRPVLRLAVDAEGQGNWRTLSLSQANLPFIPAGVALQSVKITRGSILLHRQGGDPLGRIENVNGELSAEALDGPYKFNGALKWGESEREVRVATAKADHDGSMRLKASVRADRTGNEYFLDGKISDLTGRPQITGDFGAKVAIEADRLAFDPRGKVLAERPAFDLKAKLEGDGVGVTLRELTLSFESVGQPQLITGEAKADWSDAPRLDVTLASRWLDLDRIAGSAEGTAPLEVTRNLLAALVSAMPDEVRTATTFSVDQVALGGEAVSGIEVALVRTDGPLRLERLRAGMPGGTRVDLEGELSSSQDRPAFKGKIGLHGANLGRFLAWASRTGASSSDGRAGGPFAVRGELDATANGVDVTNAVAELAGMPLEGDIRYRADGRRKLGVRLEGRTVDLAQLWPGLTLEAIGQWLFAADGASEGEGPRPEDLSFEVRLAELIAGDRTLRDLDAAFSIEAGKLIVRGLSFKSADGLAFGLDGAVEGLGAGPHGTLQWTLEAPSASSVEPFTGLAEADAFAGGLLSRVAVLAPLRVAGSVSWGQHGADSADIMVDGMAGGDRLTANARLDGGLSGWRDALAEATVTIESPDIARLSRELAGFPAMSAKEATQPARGGKVFVAAIGVPARGVAATASLAADGLEADFNGTVIMPPTGAIGDIDGRTTIAARSARDALALAGLPSAPATSRSPVSGSLDIARKSGTLTVKPDGLTIGSAEVSGLITASNDDSNGARLLADLDVSEAALGSLLTALLDDTPVEVSGEVEPASKKGVWPGEPFDFSGLDGVLGEVKVDFARLEISDGLILAPARLEAQLSPGKVEVTKLDGSALGGTLGSALTLEKEAAGVSLRGALRLAGIELGALKRAEGDRAASGGADIELSFSGQALSPSALVAALEGSGKIELRSARLAGLTPAGVGAATDGVLLGRTPGKGEGLIKALLAGLAQGELEIGSRDIPIAIQDGAARVKSFTVESGKGRTTSEITVDLATFEVDSEWRIELAPVARNPSRPPLPPLAVVYVGPLGALSSIEPRLTADAFERELAVRRLERDVDELERLRKEDEERTRAEAERQKALDAERARAAQSAPSGIEPSEPSVEPDASWEPSAAPDGAESASPQASGGAAVPPVDPAAEAVPGTPASQRGLSNAAPARPRKRPPAFNPWGQLDRSFQN